VFYCNLEALPGGLAAVKGLLPVVKLIDNFEAQYGYIANDGTSFVFQVRFLERKSTSLGFPPEVGTSLRHAGVCALIRDILWKQNLPGGWMCWPKDGRIKQSFSLHDCLADEV
jgi:hypothetical protein